MQKATAMTVVSLSGTNITEANYEFLLNSNDNLTGNAAMQNGQSACLTSPATPTARRHFQM